MDESNQEGGSSHRVLNKSSSEQETQDEMSQSKARKRENPEDVQDASKREKSLKLEDRDSGHFKEGEVLKIEDIGDIAHRDEGLTNIDEVNKLWQLMVSEHSDSSKKSPDLLPHRIELANIIASTENDECLKRFLELGGLPILDEWLQDAHKGKIGETDGIKDGDLILVIEDLMLVLLKALEKLPVDLDALRVCLVGKSVNNLRSHKNLEIQKKARKLVDTWKKRVDAEMKSSGDLRHNSSPLSAKQLSTDTVVVKYCPPHELGAAQSTLAEKVAQSSSPSVGDVDISKEHSVKSSSSIESDARPSTLNEDKSNISHQSPNSQSLVSKSHSASKEDFKSSTSTSTDSRSTTTAVHSHNSTGRSSLVETPNDSMGVKQNSSNEKLTDKGISDGTKAESLVSHRIIVRIPNPTRSYIPLLAVTDKTCTASSLGTADKHFFTDVEVVNVTDNSRSHGDSVEEQVSGECESSDAQHSPVCSAKNCSDITQIKVASDTCWEDTEADNKAICKEDCASESCRDPVKDDAKALDDAIDDNKAKVSTSSYGEVDTSAHVQEERVKIERDPVLEKIQNNQIEESYQGNPVLAKTENDEKDKHDEDIFEVSNRDAASDSPKSPCIMSPAQNSKVNDLLSGYFEEDALEVARQVAIEVEHEVEEDEEYSKPDNEDLDRMEQLHESPSPQTNESEIVKDLSRTGNDDEGKITKMNDTAEENRDANQISCCHDKLSEQTGALPAENSVQNEMNIKETKDNGGNEELQTGNTSSSVITEGQATDPTTEEAPVVSEVGSKGNGMPMRPVFDLNEGFLDDDSCNDTSACGTQIVPDIPTQPAVTGVIATPIAVFPVSKGGFTPPSNPLKSKLYLGWKGSAATSAFRPAEPRRTTDVAKRETAMDIPRPPRNLEFDLNVADEIVTEESSLVCSSDTIARVASINEPNADHSGVRHTTPFRPELDLNRVDEGDENSGPASTSSRAVLDFDLNDGPGVEETARIEPSKNSHGIVVYDDSYTNCRVGNNHHCGTVINPVQSTMVSESLHQNPVTQAALNTANHMLGSYSGFQLASPPSYMTTSMSYTTSLTSPHMVAVGSPYIRPYVSGVVEVPKADTNSRCNLDLNAGPDLVEIDPRMWQVPAFGQLSFQQATPSSSDFIKRKEPDSGFDQYRSGLKQMNWL